MIETTKNPKKPNEWRVYLSGKKSGTIVRDDKSNTFRYVPTGAKWCAGEPYPTLAACVKSLETEQETS